MRYTVAGLYAGSYQRWAEVVEADDPAEAEEKAQAQRDDNAVLLVAGVFEGEHQAVDQDPVVSG